MWTCLLQQLAMRMTGGRLGAVHNSRIPKHKGNGLQTTRFARRFYKWSLICKYDKARRCLALARDAIHAKREPTNNRSNVKEWLVNNRIPMRKEGASR